MNTLELNTFRHCEQALKLPDLKQALYDEGAVLMDGVLVTLHGAEHRTRRLAEMKVFRRDFFKQFEQQVIPGIFNASWPTSIRTMSTWCIWDISSWCTWR